MKTIFSVILGSVFSLSSASALASESAAAAMQRLTCVNEAHSTITFALSIAEEKAHVLFGETGDQSAIEKDLVGKQLDLSFDEEASARGYIQYDGNLLVNSYAKEYREVQIRFAKSELEKTSGIRVIMSPSNSFYPGSSGSAFSQYGMKCGLAD